MPSSRSLEERTEITRFVLEAPIEASHQSIAVQLRTISRDTVRQIRYGIINADILPEIPRLEKGCLDRTCSSCVHFNAAGYSMRGKPEYKGVCDLGFAESQDMTCARGCPAYWLNPNPVNPPEDVTPQAAQ